MKKVGYCSLKILSSAAAETDVRQVVQAQYMGLRNENAIRLEYGRAWRF